MQCPRCGDAVVAGQEYCLECGLRLPGVTRLGATPAPRRSLLLPLLVAGLVAIAGATAAMSLTRESPTEAAILTATGGSEPVPAAAPTPTDGVAGWPARTSAWTNVLASVPKVNGRDAALARAEAARSKGLRQVGVLDSSRYASLHPGYWVVFSGIYASEPEATSRLREAKGVQRDAHTARISG